MSPESAKEGNMGSQLTLNVPEIHPMTYGQGQEYHFLGHQS